MVEKHVSHYAFSDESNIGKYHSIGMLTIRSQDFVTFENTFINICSKHGFNNLRNVKWRELHSADLRRLVLDIMDLVIKCATRNKLRVDVLVWDVQDSRHRVYGRDDKKNLAIMYYKLFNDVFMKRWPEGAVWKVCPDRNNVIDWNKIVEILTNKGLVVSLGESEGVWREINLVNRYLINIAESTPSNNPLIQIADLFTGMASYSRENFKKWEEWKIVSEEQSRVVPPKEEISLSSSDKERCTVMNSFKNGCDENNLGVSLESSFGFRSMNPKYPINFWFYIPQHENDKAPDRSPRQRRKEKVKKEIQAKLL